MTIVVCAVRPDSRGTIMARSADPFEAPAIRPNYLSAASDEQVLLSGTRRARRIFAASPLARHSAAETMPGHDMDSDDALIEFMHRAGMNLHHPVGTCRMGEDPMAVVDSRLRVQGNRRTARRRRFGDADSNDRQHQRADHHDRRERRGNDPRGRRGVRTIGVRGGNAFT